MKRAFMNRAVAIVASAVMVVGSVVTLSLPLESTSAGASSSVSGTLNGAMSSGAIDSMDPNRWYFAVTWGLANAMCTTLLRYQDVSGTAGTKLIPGLANLPTVSANGLVYTYTLRPGAKFSDGQAITTADIKYTYMRLMNPAINTGTGGYFTNLIGGAAYLAGTSKTLAGITTTSTTITFHLTQPDGAFLYKTALPTTCPVPVGTAMKPIENGSLEEKYASGPYKLQSYSPGRSIVLVYNNNYDQALGARGHVAKFNFTIGVESSQAVLEIQSGQLDFQTSNLATADILRISHNASLASQVKTSARPDITYLFLNNQVAPLNNIDVRKAINYAINRDAILSQWGGPLAGTVTDQIIPSAFIDYKKFSTYPDTPNLTMAKQLMKDSGVKTPIKLDIRAQNDAPGFMNIAYAVQGELSKIGIDLTVQGSPNSVNSSYITNYKSHTAMGVEPWSADFPDGEAIVNTQLDPNDADAPSNLARFGATAYKALFTDATEKSGSARITAYQNLDQQVMDDEAPIAPLFNPRWYDFVSTKVGGYVYSEALDSINYNTLTVK